MLQTLTIKLPILTRPYEVNRGKRKRHLNQTGNEVLSGCDNKQRQIMSQQSPGRTLAKGLHHLFHMLITPERDKNQPRVTLLSVSSLFFFSSFLLHQWVFILNLFIFVFQVCVLRFLFCLSMFLIESGPLFLMFWAILNRFEAVLNLSVWFFSLHYSPFCQETSFYSAIVRRKKLLVSWRPLSLSQHVSHYSLACIFGIWFMGSLIAF